ncbi:glycosyltransferase [Herbiconiux liukaitaii]|uniref:glycosyltransferase n=1 Tax=Herbiconiux liukaitaii TaxID=3342799 RepID=UPI0035BB6E9C
MSSIIRVLHSVAGPDGKTRFIDQMVVGAPADVTPLFFSWKSALLGDYDVLHVHWPEMLIRDQAQWKAAAKRFALKLLLLKLRRRSIPVVRTLHNVTPHEAGRSSAEQRALGALDAATTLFIRLNPTTPLPLQRPAITILHGHYIERFSHHPAAEKEPGRILYFGLIRPYKGVDRLIEQFTASDRSDLTLRVVGKPTAELRDVILSASRNDPRITSRLEFVEDADLVEEVRRAELVVLPYRQVENSGVVLVALSLGRPVLITASPSSLALADEVGTEWVSTFDDTFTMASLERALLAAKAIDQSSTPNLAGREWDLIGEQHRDAYRDAITKCRAMRKRGKPGKSSVFVSAVGQDSNVGDSVLRRAYLDALRHAGTLHVLTGDNSSSYITGLGLQDHDVPYASRRAWWRAALKSAASDRTVIAYNAGEMQSNRSFAISYLRHLALFQLARLRGGHGIHIGMGIRRHTRLSKVIGLLLKPAAIVSWRDDSSRRWSRVGEVNPDWAFATGPVFGAASVRPRRLAISLRGDRGKPSNEWVSTVKSFAEAEDLDVEMIVQVERDAALAAALAGENGWAVVEWNGADHIDQERLVRERYSQCAAVISDRLHALVIGATEGAVPLGYSPSSTEKISRTLSAAGFADYMFDQGAHGESAVIRMRELLARSSETSDLVHAARERLNEMSARIKRLP